MGLDVTLLSLRYIHRFYDRHGKLRFYFRRKGQKVRLPGAPGSREFMEAYQAALNKAPKPKQRSDAVPGTMKALAISWKASARFRNTSPATQRVYGRIVDALIATHGDKRVSALERRHIARMVDAKAATPAAANRLRSVLHLMMKHAMREQLRADDPTLPIERVQYHKKGFPTWTEEDIAAFETRWPLGTREYLAFALLLYTAQRRSDVIRMGPKDVKDNAILVTPQKTERLDEPVKLLIPMHPELAAAIKACELSGTSTFLVTRLGQPFASGNAFYNWFIECVRAAGVSKSPHGLRKAAARRVAEDGGTVHHIKSLTGHKTLSEIQRYTEGVQQESMARAAVDMMRGARKK